MPASRTETPYLIALLSLNGFASQAARVTDMQAADVLDEYLTLGTEAIEGAGGTVVKFLGDGLLAVFPPQHADSAVLGLLAFKPVADLFFRKRHWECRLIVRLHYGAVVAGPLGPPAHQRFDVIGRAVNIAVRLESRGVAMSVEAFRQLGPDVRKHFKKHTPPITYIRAEEPHRSSAR
jgi:adenylate cyclase